MITWDLFPLMSLVSVILWLSGAVMALVRKHCRGRSEVWLMVSGTMVYACFVAGLWLSLGRPPLRTLGETRLWYSLFMMLSGVAVYARWHYRWLPLFSLVVVMVFTAINILCPDIHDRTRMVRTACHCIHVFLQSFRLCVPVGSCRVVAAYVRIPASHRSSCGHRHCLPHVRNGERLPVGKAGLGRILELGP